MGSLDDRARELFAGLQDEICRRLEEIDGGRRFLEQLWSYPPQGDRSGGGGASRVLQGGRVFEKAGVNLADVRGELSERLASRLRVPAQPFRAVGVSVVVHPLSPMVPAVHMNLRFIRLTGTEASPAWFGGGSDLTPYYLYEEDATHFHRVWKSVCDRHDATYYPRFKKWCDDYFWLDHRGEARGVGGIFFDDLREGLEHVLRLVQDLGAHFLEAYVPIVERRAGEAWWDREREWQLIRRGRYVEFNLIHDRGTLFGLETRGRTESILMSLPPVVRWPYDYHPAPGSREEALLGVLARPRDWA
jgi:coproporphyrinogen III oxidase